MTRAISVLADQWFAPAPAARLASLRIVAGVYGLWYVGRRVRMIRNVARSDPKLFEPVGVAKVHSRPLPLPVVDAALGATLAANVAYVAGWRYPITGPLYGASLLWLLSYRNSWSMIYHTDNAFVLHVLILGCAPAADVMALDAGREATRLPATLLAGRDRSPAGDWHYGWPINLANAVTAATYLVAGVAKVAGPLGRQWASGDGLRSQIAVDALRKELLGNPAPALTMALYDKVALFRVLAAGSLLLELGAPLALADHRLGRLWAVSAFVMHWGIWAVMKITFRYQLSGAMYAPFFDVERAAGWLARNPIVWRLPRWPRRPCVDQPSAPGRVAN